MQAQLNGRVAVVTGGAGGIGAGVVRRLVTDGAACVIADLDEERGRSLAQELGPQVVFRRSDVTMEQDVAGAVGLAVDRFGSLDVMVNNAGVLGAVGPLAQTPLDEWERTLSVLVTSAFLGTKHAGRVMLAQGSGSIVNMASTAGVQGGLGPHAYTAAKHAVIGLSRSAAVEFVRHGVRVNAVAPGATVSGMTASVLTGDAESLAAAELALAQAGASGRAALPADIAATVAFLARDESWHVNGHCLVVDGTNEVLSNQAWAFFAPPV